MARVIFHIIVLGLLTPYTVFSGKIRPLNSIIIDTNIHFSQ